MPQRPLRVALVNDHPLVVHGLASLLEPHADRVDVVELDAGLPTRQPVDLALFDAFAMEGEDQPQLDRLLQDPLVDRVVVFTWHVQDERVEQTLRRGVAAVIGKGASATELVDALVAAAHDDPPPPPCVSVPDAMPDWPGRLAGLTAREAEIVTLITQGLSNYDIAARTYLSINSVKSYIRTAYRTMGVTNRSQAILWGLDHGLRPEPTREVL